MDDITGTRSLGGGVAQPQTGSERWGVDHHSTAVAAGAVEGIPTDVGQAGQWGVRVEHHCAADARAGPRKP